MGAPKAVIFDFDGTLADSAPIIRSIYADLAAKNKWKVMTDKDYEILRRGSLNDARKWSGIRIWQYPATIWSAKRLMKLEAENVKLFPGIAELIRDLRARDIELYVLSRNLHDTIKRVLERHNIQDELEIVSRRRSLGNKSADIKYLLRRKRYNNDDVWIVGDEVRDIRAAHKAGIKSVAVGWGMQDSSILERFKPTYMVSSVRELRRILQ